MSRLIISINQLMQVRMKARLKALQLREQSTTLCLLLMRRWTSALSLRWGANFIASTHSRKMDVYRPIALSSPIGYTWTFLISHIKREAQLRKQIYMHTVTAHKLGNIPFPISYEELFWKPNIPQFGEAWNLPVSLGPSCAFDQTQAFAINPIVSYDKNLCPKYADVIHNVPFTRIHQTLHRHQFRKPPFRINSIKSLRPS